MNRKNFFIAALIAVTIVSFPSFAPAQTTESSRIVTDQNNVSSQSNELKPNQPAVPSTDPDRNQAGGTAGQVPQPTGGIAVVSRVDRPENCLRIRSGPGASYDVIGCAELGQQLKITGVWTSNEWAQLADNAGWVYGGQIDTDLRPAASVFTRSRDYVIEEEYPIDVYSYSDYYLPDYGYQTYWYGGIPLYVYNLGVWNRFHPWWRHAHRHHDRDFRQGRTGRERNFAGTRDLSGRNFNRNNGLPAQSNIAQGRNLNRTRNFRQQSLAGPGISNRAFRPNTGARIQRNTTINRYNSSSLNLRSGVAGSQSYRRNFSANNAFRRQSTGTRQFNAGRLGGFNAAAGSGLNTARMGSRSFSGSIGSGPRISSGIGGTHFGTGGAAHFSGGAGGRHR